MKNVLLLWLLLFTHVLCFNKSSLYISARDTEQTVLNIKRFSGAKKPVNLEFIKGTLLVIADQMAGTIADVIQENAELEGGSKIINL